MLFPGSLQKHIWMAKGTEFDEQSRDAAKATYVNSGLDQTKTCTNTVHQYEFKLPATS